MPADPPLRFRSPVDAGGFVLLAGVVLKDLTLSDGAKVTYMLLLDYARQDAACWPGQGTLATARGLKERAIRNHLTELEGRGLITIEQRGLRQTNVYWIESVERVYNPNSPFDRQKNAGQERQNSAGQVRQKNADKEDAEGIIHSRKSSLNVGESLAAEPPAPQHPDRKPGVRPDQRPTTSESESNIYQREILDAIEEAVALTGDDKSRRRGVQLREICVESNATAAWIEALAKTRQRLARGDVVAPGAYLQVALLRELDKRGIVPPSGTVKEREGVRGAIGASLGLSLDSSNLPSDIGSDVR